MLSRRKLETLALFGFVVAAAAPASAQHGVSIFKSCISPKCVGDTTDCEIGVGHADFFGDTVRIEEVFDIVDPANDAVRVPAVGNLEIVEVSGNTTCSVGGSLPCNLGPGGSVLSGLPGDPNPGLVFFASDTYVIQADDPDPLPDQGTARVTDLCDDPDTTGCSGQLNTVQFSGSTDLLNCDDGDLCTEDSCTAGECTNTPIDCDDDNPCTVDSCDDGCINTPDCVTNEDCSDGNACTDDVCTGLGCCENPPITCNDENECTEDSCNPDTGCVYTPDCVTDADCDDDNACTTDNCTAEGCCEYSPVVCDDMDPCTNDSCDSTSGCQFVDNGTCGGGEGCTPGYWKLVDADPAEASHECNWTDPYDPTDLFDDHFENAFPGKTLLDVLSLGGGGLNALGLHTVAALLNAASPDVEYDINDPQDVIDAFNAVFPGTKEEYNDLKNEFAGFNEQDCPIANCNDRDPAGAARSRDAAGRR
jgi:hypothetical protein